MPRHGSQFLYRSTLALLAALALLALPGRALAQATPPTSATPPSAAAAGGSGGTENSPRVGSFQLPDLSQKETFSSAMQIIVLLTVLSLAPAILIMMTSFTRMIIVLSLLRQALGTASLPPNQVLVGLSLFMTFIVM